MVNPVTKVKYKPSPRGQRSSQVISSPNTSCNRRMLDKMGHTTNKVCPSSCQNFRRIVLLTAPFVGLHSRTRRFVCRTVLFGCALGGVHQCDYILEARSRS